jgi:nitroimidazol reductase NimA-like FMN-containing flavoprotein (pyridoxamine 5'-phosphate oxidase superfamily)
MRYRSVIGYGLACFIEDCEEKKKGLNCIMRHYSDETHQFSDEEIRNVCVIRIHIDTMTGKKYD